MANIFTKIINKEIPSYIVAEEGQYLAFLDIHPMAKGHTLVVPKKEVAYIFDLDDETLSGLQIFSKKVALGIQKAIPCIRIGTAVVGLEVPHTHIHLVPLNSMFDIDFRKPKLKFTTEELNAIATQIRRAVEN